MAVCLVPEVCALSADDMVAPAKFLEVPHGPTGVEGGNIKIVGGVGDSFDVSSLGTE